MTLLIFISLAGGQRRGGGEGGRGRGAGKGEKDEEGTRAMVAQLIEHWTRALKCSGWNPKQISILLDVCISSALYLSHLCILIVVRNDCGFR